MPEQDIILIDRNGPRATITMNRTQRRNALCRDLLQGIKDFFQNESQKPSPARAVVIRSNGPAFSAGSDFDELKADIISGAKDHTSESSELETAFRAIEDYPFPVIARLHGGVYGAGVMLSCACDIRIGVKGMKFSKNPAKLGLIYPPVGIDRLVNIVGPVFAREMLLTGGVYDDETALRQGFITHLLDEAEADGYIDTMAEDILKLSPAAVKGVKEMFRLLQQDPIDHERLKELHQEVSKGPDAVEGVMAIVDKRKPVWK